jgi:hypothetical protein
MNVTNLINKQYECYKQFVTFILFVYQVCDIHINLFIKFVTFQYECYKLDKQTIWMLQTWWTNNMNVTSLINKQYDCLSSL